MNNAELIKALRHCAKGGDIAERCLPCGYYDREPWCESALATDAADAIEAADKRIAELEAQIPKEGEWIEVHDWIHIPQEERGTHRCSACGQVMKYPWNFCPNCGARMKGEQE